MAEPTQKSVKPKRGRPSRVELVRRALIQLREKSGITHAAVARRAGVSRKYLCVFLAGGFRPSPAKLDALVDAVSDLAAKAWDIAIGVACGKKVTA